jgi:predicted RNase H-like nuclease
MTVGKVKWGAGDDPLSRFGWISWRLVAAWIDDQGNHGFDYSSYLGRILSMPHQRAMIDMPIGLKMSGHRRCDISARCMLARPRMICSSTSRSACEPRCAVTKDQPYSAVTGAAEKWAEFRPTGQDALIATRL